MLVILIKYLELLLDVLLIPRIYKTEYLLIYAIHRRRLQKHTVSLLMYSTGANIQMNKACGNATDILIKHFVVDKLCNIHCMIPINCC